MTKPAHGGYSKVVPITEIAPMSVRIGRSLVLTGSVKQEGLAGYPCETYVLPQGSIQDATSHSSSPEVNGEEGLPARLESARKNAVRGNSDQHQFGSRRWSASLLRQLLRRRQRNIHGRALSQEQKRVVACFLYAHERHLGKNDEVPVIGCEVDLRKFH